MNIEELKKLKEKLENENNSNKYVVVSQFCQRDIFNASTPENLEHILSQENTDEVIHQCEILMEKAIRGLTAKGIPFDQLVISSNLGLVCKTEYVDKLKSFYHNPEDGSDEKFVSLMAPLAYQVATGIVPVCFNLNLSQTGTEDYDVDSYAEDSEIDYNSLYFGRVSGIVDWEKFVEKMKSLGYNISLLNYEIGNSFEDCIESVKKNGFDTQIDVIADLGRTLKSTHPRR